MAALSALSNLTGSKHIWKDIVSRYDLKWKGRNDIGDLVGLLYANSFDDMVMELKASLESVPADYSSYFTFDLLVGLRASESVRGVNMLRMNPKYLNQEMKVLEHFRYPTQFIRNTKKCFISVVDEETLEIARATRSLDYQGIRSEFRRRNLPFRMRYCCKLFATYMRKHVDVELVDLLQGRVPSSIFARYYNRPNYRDEMEKVRSRLPELRRLLE